MQAVQPLPFLADRQAAPLTNTFKSGELLRDAFKSGELLRDTFKSGELQRDTFKSNEVLPDETSWSLPSSGKPRPEAPLNQPAAPQRESKPPGSLAFELGRQRQKSVSLPEPSTVEDATPPEYALLPPIQTHNAVWYGPDMLKRKHEWFELLSLPEIAELETAARAWLAAHPDIPNTDIAIHSPDEFPLPTMKARLLSLRRELQHGRGFAVFHNLPVRRLTERELITIFSGIASYLGKPRSQNAQGDLVGNVRDAGLSSTDPNVRIYQTRERQGFHCDWADVVGLLCINPAMKGGQSLLCSSSTIWNEMRRKRPDLAAALLEPVATDRRGEVADGELPYNLVPVFNYYKGYLTALYHRPYIESAQRFPDAPRLTALQREAIEMFDQLAQSEDIHFEMRLGPGDMQFVYNHTLLHDRTAYEDWPSDTVKRHLLRVWVALPEDRPLPEVFASRYGSVEVGNRGGVKVTKPRPSAVAAPK